MRLNSIVDHDYLASRQTSSPQLCFAEDVNPIRRNTEGLIPVGLEVQVDKASITPMFNPVGLSPCKKKIFAVSSRNLVGKINGVIDEDEEDVINDSSKSVKSSLFTSVDGLSSRVSPTSNYGKSRQIVI